MNDAAPFASSPAVLEPTPQTIAFLERLRPSGPWVLTAIPPDPGPMTTITARNARDVRVFISQHNGKRNLYYSVNPIRQATNKKAAKTNIAAIEFGLADCDPAEGETPEAAKARYLAALKSTAAPNPTFIVDSGNGLQFGWRLDKPIPLPEPIRTDKSGESIAVLSDNAQAIVDDVEARIKAVMERLGAKAGTQNIDRILRLPGTTNLPNKAKRARGRVECPATLIEFNESVHALASFPEPEPDTAKGKAAGAGRGGSKRAMKVVGVEELRVSERIKAIIRTGENLDGADATRSGAVWTVCLALAAQAYDDAQFQEIFLDPAIAISAHVLEQPKPEEYLAQQIEKARAKTADSDVARVNEDYALVVIRNHAAILLPNEPVLTVWTLETFREWFAEHFVRREGFKDGKPRPLADHWRAHPQKRKYRGIEFAPGRETSGYFNLFRGWPIKPKPGDWGLFRDHLLRNVCGGDDAIFKWVFGWFAQIIQHPEAKPGTSLALRGPMGVGKTIVGDIFGALLGPHYLLVDSSEYVIGKFNAYMISLLLLQSDEAVWAGDHAAASRIKGLVTSKRQMVQLKGIDAFQVPNHVRLLLTGNEDWIVPAGMDERRFTVLDVGENNKQDHVFFGKLITQMENGGYEALMHDALQFDLSSVNLREVLKTDALREQKIASLTPEQKWWLDTLMKGELPWGVDDEVGCCPCDRLQARYQAHARRSAAKPRAIATELGIFLRKHAQGIARRERDFNIWNERKSRIDLQRGYVYRFPSLAECRKAFDKKMQQHFEWPDPGPLHLERANWVIEPRPDIAPHFNSSDDDGFFRR